MDALDYVEDQARRNVAFRLETRELLHKRATQLCLLLLGAGGAIAAWSLEKIGVSISAGAVALLSVAAWLFVVSGWVAARCLPTAEAMPPGNEPGNLLLYLDKKKQAGASDAQALEETRRAELDALQKRIKGYAAVNQNAAMRLDLAYKAATMSPIIGLIALGVSSYLLG